MLGVLSPRAGVAAPTSSSSRSVSTPMVTTALSVWEVSSPLDVATCVDTPTASSASVVSLVVSSVVVSSGVVGVTEVASSVAGAGGLVGAGGVDSGVRGRPVGDSGDEITSGS